MSIYALAYYTVCSVRRKRSERRQDTAGGYGLLRPPWNIVRRTRAGPALRRGHRAAPQPEIRRALRRPDADGRLRRGPPAGEGDRRGATRQADRDGRGKGSHRDPEGSPP